MELFLKLIERSGNRVSSLSSKVDGGVSSESLSSVKSESSSKRFCKCAAVLVSALVMKFVACILWVVTRKLLESGPGWGCRYRRRAYGKMTLQAATADSIFASALPLYQAAVFMLNEIPRVQISTRTKASPRDFSPVMCPVFCIMCVMDTNGRVSKITSLDNLPGRGSPVFLNVKCMICK